MLRRYITYNPSLRAKRVAALLVMTICLFIQPALGKEKPLCQPTGKSPVADKPITYDPTYTDNDTTKNSGGFDNKYLNKIVIKGIIKDKHCVPIPNASIEIWQEDEYGKKRYNQFSYSFSDRYELNREQYSNFLGIAATTSDNNGQFTFISVIPNGKLKESKKQSLINIAVSHQDFPKLENQIILNPKFPIRKSDKRIIALRELDNQLPSYDFEIVLDGTNKYKSY
jgi:protocatechuate 3,4-dioxygenase beta subunit